MTESGAVLQPEHRNPEPAARAGPTTASRCSRSCTGSRARRRPRSPRLAGPGSRPGRLSSTTRSLAGFRGLRRAPYRPGRDRAHRSGEHHDQRMPDPATPARIDHPGQDRLQGRGERDRIGQLHPAHLLSDSSNRQGCRCGHDSPMITAGVRTAMITTRAVPASSPPAACRRSSTPIHRDFADALLAGGPAHFVYPPLDGCCIYWAPSWPFDDDTVGEWVHAASMITLCAVLNDAIFDPFSTEPERLATPAPARTRTAQRELTGRRRCLLRRSGADQPIPQPVRVPGQRRIQIPHCRSRRPG